MNEQRRISFRLNMALLATGVFYLLAGIAVFSWLPAYSDQPRRIPEVTRIESAQASEIGKRLTDGIFGGERTSVSLAELNALLAGPITKEEQQEGVETWTNKPTYYFYQKDSSVVVITTMPMMALTVVERHLNVAFLLEPESDSSQGTPTLRLSKIRVGERELSESEAARVRNLINFSYGAMGALPWLVSKLPPSAPRSAAYPSRKGDITESTGVYFEDGVLYFNSSDESAAPAP